MVDSDASAGSSSSSSSDSVLIRVPLDQNRRKKLRAQLQEEQRRQLGRQLSAADPNSSFKPLTTESDSDRIKGEQICVICEREGDNLVVCAGPCISAFHYSCLAPNSGPTEANHGAWLCPSCKSKTHACFHCKETGIETQKDDALVSAGSDSHKKPVRKCRALSCGKFYHQECITQFPLARIAINTHFICPLHTCAGCNQSGAQQEAVRCMRCPVAYHAKCLPYNCVRQISSKLIICPKHGDLKQKREVEQDDKSGSSRQVSDMQAQDDNEDEIMSEASAISVSSGKKKEKKEKKEKRDKKKKKKKKKKDKHKRESLALQAVDEYNDKHGKKRKRSKKEPGDAEETFSSTPFTSRPESRLLAEATNIEMTRSPKTFKSSASATKRIQERLEEALGKSDDEESDLSMNSPVVGRERFHGLKTDTASETENGIQETSLTGIEERQARSLLTGKDDEFTNSPIPTSSVPASPSGDYDSFEARSSAEEDTSESKSLHKDECHADDASTERGEQVQSIEDALKPEFSKSPLISAMIPLPSITETSTLRLKHIPIEDEDDDDESAAGTMTPSASTTPRTPRNSRGYGKKKRRNKGKRETQRVTGRELSEEEDGEVNEAKWVQCDSCKKWRTVPKTFNLDEMPKHWYCNMNTWDKQFASCAVAEEILKASAYSQVGKRRNKLKMKSKSTASSTGDDGGYSSCESGPLKRSGGLLKGSMIDVNVVEEKEMNARSKTKDKGVKKRKMTKQLKEKYREVKWVQCESTQCGKWRVVPASINFDRLPAVWYCHLNTWAPELAKCSAPNPPEVDTFWLKQTKKEGRPTKKARTPSNSAEVTPAASVSGMASTPTSSATVITSLGKWNMTKHGKSIRSTTSVTGNGTPRNGRGNNVETTNSHFSCGDSSAALYVVKGKGGRILNNRSGSVAGVKKTVLEWAQCEKCNKWRKLPQHIKSSTLPDKWYCSMNHWDLSHAKCSIPEEVDQEPLPLPPHPGSQWHKGGHKVQRIRRGKLSYSELLYGSTGQLRKAYTLESSTLSFEYEGTTYYRDDQYKHSSMYVSPAAMAAAATIAGWSGSDRIIKETSCSKDGKVGELVAPTSQQASVDQIADLVLESMDLRHRRSISELYNAVNSAQRGPETTATSFTSLAMITAALGQLEHRGLVEKVDELSDENEDYGLPKQKRLDSLYYGTLPIPVRYRKVPMRPLKASKCWKFGGNLLALTKINDS